MLVGRATLVRSKVGRSGHEGAELVQTGEIYGHARDISVIEALKYGRIVLKERGTDRRRVAAVPRQRPNGPVVRTISRAVRMRVIVLYPCLKRPKWVRERGRTESRASSHRPAAVAS